MSPKTILDIYFNLFINIYLFIYLRWFLFIQNHSAILVVSTFRHRFSPWHHQEKMRKRRSHAGVCIEKKKLVTPVPFPSNKGLLQSSTRSCREIPNQILFSLLRVVDSGNPGHLVV